MNTSFDVLVIGGGVAGVAAASAAARGGARTALVEKERCLGGTGYAGMFQYICGLYLNGAALPTETLNPGIVREVATLVSPSRTIKQIGLVYALPYSHDGLQSALVSLCVAEKNLTILRKSAATAVEAGQREVRTVTVDGPEGTRTLHAAMVVDCTGSGQVAALAGAEFELAPANERQLAGFTFHVKGLKDADESLSIKVPYHLSRAVNQGIFSPLARLTTFSPGARADEGYCKMTIDADEQPGRDEQARKDAAAIHDYLASVLPAFNGSSIADTSLKVLEREGRRIIGEYLLTEEDVLSARKFPDGVVKNAWPVELWDRSKGTIYKYVPRGEYYEIPFRCLMVRGIANLLTAGRCISVTHEALGSTRVMGTCMSLGEQAGRAAAYRAKNGTYPENIKEY